MARRGDTILILSKHKQGKTVGVAVGVLVGDAGYTFRHTAVDGTAANTRRRGDLPACGKTTRGPPGAVLEHFRRALLGVVMVWPGRRRRKTHQKKTGAGTGTLRAVYVPPSRDAMIGCSWLGKLAKDQLRGAGKVFDT